MSSSSPSSSDNEGEFEPRRRKMASTVQMMRDIARINELKEKGVLSDDLLTEMVKCILRGNTGGVTTKRKSSKIKRALKAKKPRRPASPTTKLVRQLVEKPLMKRFVFFACWTRFRVRVICMFVIHMFVCLSQIRLFVVYVFVVAGSRFSAPTPSLSFGLPRPQDDSTKTSSTRRQRVLWRKSMTPITRRSKRFPAQKS